MNYDCTKVEHSLDFRLGLPKLANIRSYLCVLRVGETTLSMMPLKLLAHSIRYGVYDALLHLSLRSIK